MAGLLLLVGSLVILPAQAQTSCGSYSLTTGQFAGAAINGANTSGGSSIISSGADNTGNVVDASATNSGQLKVFLSGSAQLSTRVSSTTLPAGATAGYVIESGLLNLGVGQTIQITTYLNGTQQNQGLVGTVLDLPLLGTGRTFVGIPTTKPFNEVQIRLSVLVGVTVTLNVYYPLAIYTGTYTGQNPTTVAPSSGSMSVAIAPPSPITQQSPLTYTWSPNVSSTSVATGLSTGTYSATIGAPGVGCIYSKTLDLAALSCGITPLTTNNVTGVVAGTTLTGVCALCGVSSLSNVINSSLTDAATISIPLGLAGGAGINVTSTQRIFPAGTQTGFIIQDNGFLSLSLFTASTLNTYLNGTLQETSSVAGFLDLPLLTGAYKSVGFVTTKSFDKVEIVVGSIASGLVSVNASYAFVTSPGPYIANSSVTNASTSVSFDGAVSLTVTNGTPAYSYNWSNGTTVASLTGVPAGVYSVTVSGSGADCPVTKSFTVAAGADNCATTTVSLLPLGNVQSLTSTCVKNGYVYHKNSAAGNAYLSVKPNGSNWLPTSVSVDATASGTFSVSSAAGRAQLAQRMFIVVAPGSYTTNGGVTVRLYFDPAEFGSLPANRSWFKFPADSKAAVQAALSVSGLTGATYLAPSATGTENGVDYVEFNNIANFSTFGYVGTETSGTAVSPGGVSSGLQVWLKADAITGTSDGSSVGSWTNVSGSSYGNMTQPTAIYRPLYYNSTAGKLVNFNPTLYYDGTAKLLGNTSAFAAANSAYTFLSVGIDEDAGTSYRALFSSQNLVDYFVFYKFAGPANNGVSTTNGLRVWAGDLNIGKGTKYSPTNGSNSFYNGTNFTSNASTQNIQPQIMGISSTSVAVGLSGPFDSWVDGYKDVSSGNMIRYAIALQSYGVGADMTNLGAFAEFWLGRIPEQIGYNRQLSDTEIQRVNSYLAIKYGVTLGQGNGYVGRNGNNYNYVNSAGATIWNASVNSTYGYNIFGIGRDDASGLNQKQSQSVNANGLVTIGNGSVLATTNAANGNSFVTDQSLEVVGDNGRPASYSVSYSPDEFTPTVPSAFYRMARTWRVQETGTVGTVIVSVPASTKAERLLVSSDGLFGPASTQEILLNADGNGNLTATVNFNDGDHFSFGAVVVAPGCVASNIQTWLKADVGVTTSGTGVSAWANQGSSIFSLTQTTAGDQPGFIANGMNFNPAFDFKASQVLTNSSAGALVFPNSTDPVTILAVSTNRNAGAAWQTLVSFGGPLDYPSFHWYGDNLDLYVDGAGGDFQNTNNLPINTPTIGYTRVSNNANRHYDIGYNGLTQQQSFTTSTVNSFPAGGNGLLTVGSETTAGTEALNGLLTETIVYNRLLSDNELMRAQSYLAVKYGITLTDSYLSGNSTTIWSTATNAGYTSDVTGIGRDDCQALHQKQSKSTASSGFVTIGNGTALAATNTANSNAFTTDNAFELIGDNGLATSYTTTYASSFTAPTTVYSMSRIWRVQETGTVGTVTISIPGSGNSTYLLIRSANGTFTSNSGTTEIQMVPDGNGNLTAQVDLTNGQYFTFAKPLFAPGCVAADLLLWYKPEAGYTTSGSAVASWTDQITGITITPASNATGPDVAPASALFNYNPSFTFDGVSDILDYRGARFINTTSGGTLFGAALANVNAGYENLADLGIDNPHMGLLDGNQIMWLNGSGGPFPAIGGPVKNGQMQVWDYYWNTGGPGQGQRLDGTAVSYPSSTSSSLVGNYDGLGNFSWGIGGYNDRVTRFEVWTGNISEVALYNRNLTDAEKDRVDTYMAVKYGVTLKHNYLSGNGTTIYDVSSFSANVTGVGRDDCQELNQKQSKSVNAGSRLLIGVGNTITTTNANHPDSFTNNQAFVVFGDNGATGTSSFSSTTASCAPPSVVDKYTNLAYKVTETGDAPSDQLQFDISGFGFNQGYPVYMQVATDAAFGNVVSNVPMSVTNSVATGYYDFPANSTYYIRFAGNTTSIANICAAPTKQTFHWNTWWYGDKQKLLLPNYIPQSSSATAAMTMSVTVTDNNNLLLYRPTVDWWPVFDGYGLFIPRNDNTSNQNQIVTTRMQFRQGTSTSVVAAQTTDFLVYDVDGWIGGRDIVKIYGKVGSSIVTPQLSRYKPLPFDALQLNYQSDPQQAIGSHIPWDLGAWAYLYVSFSDPVEEVFVEYRKANTYSFNVYNDIRIGPVSVTCKLPTPKAPAADNVYIYKEVSSNPVKEGDPATYKFTVQNTDCAPKTINFSDVLPSGLVWRDSSFVTSETITVGSVNAYGNGSTLATTMTIPAGISYFYASVTGTVGVRNNQGTFTVQGGTGATSLTDDPTTTGTTNQPTALTIIANDPNANLVVAKSVDKITAPQNSTLTYTYRIYNPNATAVTTTFNDVLPGELTYIGSTLTGVGSATASPYSGSAVLSVRGLSVPASSTLTFTVQANTNSYTVGAVANNVAQVTPEIGSGFRIQPFNSTVASTTILSPPTVTISSPLNTTTALNPTVSGTATPGSTVVLTSSSSGTLCTTTATVGGTWSCPVNLTAGPQTLSAVASNSSGVSSPAATQITATAASVQANNPPALVATPGSSNTGNAATELAPSGGTAPYTYSNDTGNPSCSAVAAASALPNSSLTINSSTGSYSYTAPNTPGVYYFCIKVCDNTTPTPACVTKTYTLTVSPTSGAGTLDCSTAQIVGVVAGTPGNGVLRLTVSVTTAGPMSVSVNGSGLSASPNPYVINPATTGVQTFYVPITYSGAAFAANTTITVVGAGTCTVDMTQVTPRTVSTSVLNLGPACAPATAATLVK